MSTTGTVGIVGSGQVARRRWWALAFLVAGNLTVFSAVAAMTIAIPQAQAQLGFADSTRAAVLTLYALCFGTFMLLGGRLADVIGLRRGLCIGLIGFAGASALGGLAPSVHFLLSARALQGVFGAFVAAGAVATMSVLFPAGRERARAFGLYGMVMGMGTALSFAVTGALVDGASWRWVMLINVPIALLILGGVLGFAPPMKAARDARIRLGSAALITAALGLLIVGLDRAGTHGWNHGPTAVLLVIAVLLLGWFVLALCRDQDPLIPLFLLADRSRLGAICAVFLIGVGVFAGMFILTNFLQDVLGYSPLRTGLAFLPWSLTSVAAAQLLGPIRSRLPAEATLAIGLVTVAAAIASLTMLGPETTYLMGILPAMLLLGAGSTIVMVTATSSVTWNTGRHNGIAGALVNANQQVGAAVGTALLATIITTTIERQPAFVPLDEATIRGYATASGAGAILIALGAIGVVALVRIDRRTRT